MPADNEPTAASDFRIYVQELEAEGDLVRITAPVDANGELAAIVRKAYETESKAPLLTNLGGRDSKTGLCNVLGAPMGMSPVPGKRLMRMAKSLGLASTASGQHIVERVVDASTQPAVASQRVASGPVKHHRLEAAAVDLTALPQQLPTLGLVVAASPDGSCTTWSLARASVSGRSTLVGAVDHDAGLEAVRALWLRDAKDMPFALCLGVPPAAIMVAAMALPRAASPADRLGALTRRPVALAPCESNGLAVPAHAELVLEGVVSASLTAAAPPMPGLDGLLFPAAAAPQPVWHVAAMTFRPDPVVPLCVPGRAVDESHALWGVMHAAAVLDVCRLADLPIQAAWCPPETHCMAMVLQVHAARLRQMAIAMPDFCNAVGHCVFASTPGLYIAKLCLVGPDIDPTSLRHVAWAEATRCQPGASEFLFDQYPTSPLIPYVKYGTPPDAEHHYHNKLVRCCIFSSEFGPDPSMPPYQEVSFAASYPKKIQDLVNARWAEYGY